MLEGFTWANAVSLAVAVLSLAGVAFMAWLQRRSERDKITKDLKVSAQTATVDAAKLEISDKELDAKREVWVAEIAERMGSATHTLLLDAEARIARALEEATISQGRIAALELRVGQLSLAVAECEQRCAAHAERSAHLLGWARAHGWDGI